MTSGCLSTGWSLEESGFHTYFETRNKIQAILFVQQGCFLKLACSFIFKDCDVIVLKRFVINSYLRARLQKIESQIWHYTGPGEAGSRMTQV